MRPNLHTASGNNIRVLFNNTQLGVLQSVRPSDDYAPEPASGIGDIHALEYVPTLARHQVAVSKMTLWKESLRQAGLAPENGDAVLQGLVFDIVIQRKDTGEVLRKYIGCSYASGSTDINKHAIVMENAQFNCLDVAGTRL